jgi:predicted nucleotide-binding protein
MKKIKTSDKNILIVEDDLFFGRLLAETVEDFGYKAMQTQSVQSALQVITNEHFALLIVDAMLPNSPKESGISQIETRGGFQAGVALLRKLRQNSIDIPAILITGYPNKEVQDWCQTSGVSYLIKPCERQAIIENLRVSLGKVKRVRSPSCFIVHGHDEKSLEELKILIVKKLGFPEPIILKEQPGGGRTIIENLEKYATKVDIVFVLLTPDDKFCEPKDSEEIKAKARQNVIFELGLFYGYLGRLSGKVILLHSGPIDLPSDISGIIYIDISKGVTAAGKRIQTELSYWID